MPPPPPQTDDEFVDDDGLGGTPLSCLTVPRVSHEETGRVVDIVGM